MQAGIRIRSARRPPISYGNPAVMSPDPDPSPPPATDLHRNRPILKEWGSTRVLRCLSVNGKGEIIGRRSAAAGGSRAVRPRIRAPDDDLGIEEVRAKLLVHLREAADRLKYVVPEEPATPTAPAAAAGPSSSAAAESNQRRRRAPIRIERQASPSPPPERSIPARSVRLRSEDAEKRERPRFSISLTREEIDEDIYSVTGSMPRRRPRKRPRALQKQLDALMPGSWLGEVTADTYKVPD